MKKTAFKVFLMALVATSLLASCKKNDIPKDGFTASIELDSDSKTFLDGLQVKWTNYDQIKVANTASTNIVFELTSGGGGQQGIFYTGDSRKTDFFAAGGPYKAVYPATNPANTANTISGNTATINLPATQNILVNGTFGVGYNPMVAYSTDQTLQFKNVCGALYFPIVGVGTVKTIQLTTGNSGDRISGVFNVNCSTAAVINSSGGGNTITLTCPGSGVTLNATTPANFYFMLPPGALGGVTLTARDASNNVVYTKTSSQTITIQRNKIIPVNELEVPLKVTTASPTNITTSSAKGGVTVTNGTPTETGICWGTSTLPTVSGSHATGTTGINMSSLTANTIYYVRAYAISVKGNYYYGSAIPFSTLTTYSDGKLPNPFTVTSGGRQVYFSKGNLQFHCKNLAWRFAEHQYDVIGSANSNIAEGYNGYIDLFGYGTSNYAHGATYYRPWDVAEGYDQYATTDLNNGSASTTKDWGYNKISNGGNAEGKWRTLLLAEWKHLLLYRSGYRFSYATVMNVKGILIYPDGFTPPSGLSLNYNNPVNESTAAVTGGTWTNNVLNEAQWSLLQQKGVAFIPTAGHRSGTSMNHVNNVCYYWSASKHENYIRQRYACDISSNRMSLGYYEEPHNGMAVRLVKNK